MNLRISWIPHVIACLLLSCSAPKHTLTGLTMGTSYRVVLRGTDLSPLDSTALRAAIQAEFDRLERIFSTYRKDSEISQLNRHYRLLQPHPVSNDMAEVLRIAAVVQNATGGAFSPFVGELVNFWGFGPGGETRAGELPPRSLSCTAQAEFTLLPGNDRRTGIAPTVFLVGTKTACNGAKPRLDLSAVAKGYAVDRLGELLTRRGFSTYLIEVGGEVCTRAPAGGPAWRVGIEDPVGTNRLAQAMEIDTGCVATSGNARQARWISGHRITHIVDPRTGNALERRPSSVSVMAATAAEADAWATAFYVLGRHEAIRLADTMHLPVMYLEEASGKAERFVSVAWPHEP